MTDAALQEPVDDVLRRTEQVTGIGMGLSSLEYLVRPKQFEKHGLLSWDVGRTKYRWTASRKMDKLSRVLDPPGVQGVIVARMIASVVLAAPGTDQRMRTVATGVLTATNWVLHVRNSYGTDGTDHMNTLLCTALTASKLFPHDSKAREACTMFIAAQSALSYFAAGLAKAFSPYWRDGSAMSGIFRTHTYGHKQLGKLFKRYPLLSKAGGWATIIGEMAFPLALIGSRPLAKLLLSTGVSFHIGNGLFMGLNRFIWAFGATYPSLMHHSKSLSERAEGGASGAE